MGDRSTSKKLAGYPLALICLLIGCCVVAVIWFASNRRSARDAREESLTAEIERLRESYVELREKPYTSDPNDVKTLEDVDHIGKVRGVEFFPEFTEDPEGFYEEYFRHVEEFRARPRSPHEMDIIATALQDEMSRKPMDLKKITDICDYLWFGRGDARILELLKEVVSSVRSKYSEPEIDRGAAGITEDYNEASYEVSNILERIGYIGLPEAGDYLLTFMPKQPPPELDVAMDHKMFWGALRGLANLPPHLGIPVLEGLFLRWFPGVPPETIELGDPDLEGLYQYLLRLIDDIYRTGRGEWPRESPAGPLEPVSWPLPTHRYGPGGIKLEPFPVVRDDEAENRFMRLTPHSAEEAK